MNKIKTALLALLFVLLPYNSLSGNKPQKIQDITNVSALNSLDSLKTILSSKGYNIDTLVSNTNFMIHEKITDYFVGSAEIRAREKYQKAKGKDREMLFRRAFDEYKTRLGLDDKKLHFQEFLNKYLSTLDSAETLSGIPKEVLAAVIGVESDYGKNKGNFFPFNAYASLYIFGDSIGKREFALKEISELIRFCEKNNISVYDLKSSYAGAIGYGQFIPSSLNAYFLGTAVYNLDTCIMSAGNYLRKNMNKNGNLESAILTYNNDSCYLEAVLELSKTQKE